MQFREERRNLGWFVILFSFFAILGTYSGVRVTGLGYLSEPWAHHISSKEAIANARTIGVVIAGLLGGWRAGLAVGTIAGIHRYTLGGFVALPCMIAPIIQGAVAGFFKNSVRNRYRHVSSVQMGFAVGFLAEFIQMMLILLLARPWSQALSLVELIGIPQVLSNSLGVAMFFAVLIQVQRDEDQVGAAYAGKALEIAEQTLTYWRSPLTEAARHISAILLEGTEAIGAAFFKEQNEELALGEKTPYSIDLPIIYKQQRVGFFCLYYERKQDKNNSGSAALIKGLSQLFSQQYALAEAERQDHLVNQAEIKSLQAQMNPHFLFNMLNSIKSLIRSNQEEARRIITQLAKYIRKNMQSAVQEMIPIREELQHIQVYLDLVKVRMGSILSVELDLDETCLDETIPPLTIQPLVENAVNHGFKHSVSDARLQIFVKDHKDKIMICVKDNGEGFKRHNKTDEQHLGFALHNIQQRLHYYFGERVRFEIESSRDKGTSVSFYRPRV